MLWILLLVAPFIGSFLGVVVTRLADGRPVLWGRSACDACGHKLGWIDLIPLISWLASRARCRYCHARLGGFYPAIEIAAVAVVSWGATETSGAALIASCVLGWTLLALALIDWRAFILPDALTVFLLLSGAAASYGLNRDEFGGHLIGALAGFLVFAAIAALYRWLRGRSGMGAGDAKLMAGAGLWLGWLALPSVVLFGAGLGLLVVLMRTITGQRLLLSDRLPFGTFLAAATWLVWLYGPLVPA